MIMELGLIKPSTFLVLLISVFFIFRISKGFSRSPSEDVSFVNLMEEAFCYLNITSVNSFEVKDSDECGFSCVESTICFSYNLEAFSVDGKRLCELLPSDKYNNLDKLIVSPRFHHYSIQSPCRSGPCQNNGTCVSLYEKDSYECVCVKGFTGKHCQTALVNWALGTYGLPMTKSGCPQGSFWHIGTRFHDTEDGYSNNAWSSPYDLAGKVAKNDMEQKFCIKTQRQTTQYDSMWPEGEYCIFKKGNCPDGMESAFIKWDDENSNNRNLFSGQLPDGIYDKDTKIQYCCCTDGKATDPINLPTESPFVLLKANTGLCQKVNGMQARLEFFKWDSDDKNPSTDYVGSVNAKMDDKKDIILYYCYYYK